MPSTTRQNLSYPLSSDAPNGPQQIADLAGDIDVRPAWRGVGSSWPGSIQVGDCFYHTTLRCTMRAMTTSGSWKQQDVVFLTTAADRTAWLASVTAAGLSLHEGFLAWQDDTNQMWVSPGGNSLGLLNDSDTGWAAASVTSGWSGGVSYRVKNGILSVHVFTNRASWGGADVIATLPANARPSLSVTFLGSVNFGATIYELRLNTDGTVVVNSGGAGGVFATLTLVL